MARAAAILAAGWLGAATVAAAAPVPVDAAFVAKQVEVSKLSSDLSAMRGVGSADRAQALEARQAFLASLLGGKRDLNQLATLLPRASSNDLATARDLIGAKRGKPVADPFRDIESQQLALVDKTADSVESRVNDTTQMIRKLGLDPSRFAAPGGVGGPYVAVRADADPKFNTLYQSWSKLAALQEAVASIPSYVPVKSYSYTSNFGVRSDPFNGGAAMHAGVDMAGTMGEPIYAAANGVVGTAGRMNGYGNLVELEHGKGIATRYGHLSAILVHAGDQVKQGQLIARMGSTGRSTGTHLHYEIRVDGRAVNPRPYLEASAYMLAAQAQGPKLAAPAGPYFEPVSDDVSVTAGWTTGL